MKSWIVWILLVAMVGGGIAVAAGDVEPAVGLESVMEIWSDVVRDTDQFGLRLTRVSAEEEMQLGRQLVGLWLDEGPTDPRQDYVRKVGAGLTPFVRRREIKYEFHVVETYYPNAFALPGGQILITTPLLGAMRSEAELAAILGHEISHVDARHCIENFQYQLAMQKLRRRDPGGGILRIDPSSLPVLYQVLEAGNSKYQELEADLQGLRIAAQAGYSPQAGPDLMDRVFVDWDLDRRAAARQPVQEVTASIDDALRDYWRTHPYTKDRVARLRQLAGQIEDEFGDKRLYVGVENYRQRRPKSELFLPSETIPTSSAAN